MARKTGTHAILKSLLCIIMLLPIMVLTTGCDRDNNPTYPFEGAIEVDLVTRYELRVWAYIWNDHMPTVQTPLRSTHFVAIASPHTFGPNDIQMSVRIVAGQRDFRRTFKYFQGTLPQGWLDFRAPEIFRIYGDYTLYVTIHINGYRQTIKLTGTVFDTH
ncbi:MAG: hypothetical protein FWE38_04795 [Firmicutes bacterium]|nr:hypothetical protein [Bacillota bacterium]